LRRAIPVLTELDFRWGAKRPSLQKREDRFMAEWQYAKGLHDLGNGCWGYLQPNGSWGYSNAGLITDEGQTLLVDTLFDLALTREMLDAMRAAVPAAAQIGTLVNTHSNGDHTYGNQLVQGAQIIASTACYNEMREQGQPLAPGSIRRDWKKMGPGGAFFQEVMGSRFSAEGVVLTLPTRTFDRELTLHVGAKEVRLLELGPAHTRGDVIVYVPQDRTIFAGDLLFIDGHPITWGGPIKNWIKACDLMLSWDVETVVPGHGPLTDKTGIRAVRDYFDYVQKEARKRFDAGMAMEEAARDISLEPFARWLDPERIVVNVATCYREFADESAAPDILALRSLMAAYYYEHKSSGPRERASAAPS